MNILITGGAGFIGSNLCLRLVEKGHQITVIDNLSEQIHGSNPEKSELYLSIKDKVNFIKGDVRDKQLWIEQVPNHNAIIHLAAETGTGQSMYEVHKYIDTNVSGTSQMLDVVVNNKNNISKIIVASSRAVYGEGAYLDLNNQIIYPNERVEFNLDNGLFEPQMDGKPLTAIQTSEGAPFKPQSVYGITKQLQEQLVLTVCKNIGIPAVALRFQNVYGAGQSLKNPYTGILSIFSTLILNNKSINIFEDGKESRDFVYVDDVVNSIILSIDLPAERSNKAFNIGTGIPTTVMEVANLLQKLYNKSVATVISGNYRKGDIRHNYADIQLAKTELGFKPQVTLEMGLKKFTDWVLTQNAIDEIGYERSLNEMKSKGIMK